MRHRINGCLINLRGLSDDELDNLARSTAERLEQVQEELDSVRGEVARRSSNVHQLVLQWDRPHHGWDPSAA